MSDEQKQIGRLAIRKEGDVINAYYAMPGTMKDALWLSSITCSAAERPEVFEAFKNLGREIVGQILFEVTGVRPSWGGEQPAPEHERAGSA